MIEVEIITPDRVFYTGKVSFIEMTTTEGEIGVFEKWRRICMSGI